jgi:outer membrane receptor for ferrienterochelin and colicin
LTTSDFALFAQNDWRLKPSLAFSFGLRYENQTGIADHTDFAPRFAFAYAPGAGSNQTPKTVFRGGVGIFMTVSDATFFSTPGALTE